jgi:hypothetical protein
MRHRLYRADGGSHHRLQRDRRSPYKRTLAHKERKLGLAAKDSAEQAAHFAAQAQKLEQRVRVLELDRPPIAKGRMPPRSPAGSKTCAPLPPTETQDPRTDR